ncbi:unnamed protein product [Brassicogethes aeneus]|uniref:Uncharacterized protein n=1 Tax=Brassicogethes aeneus TaxID=1431903 RepID=A0A9P0BGN9_BRAAE|nr:unnamed protein product [Brassicogethes aeneus]
MSDSGSSQERLSPPKKKKLKYHTSFDGSWLNDPLFSAWLKKRDDFTAECKLCRTDISVKYEGKRALVVHSEAPLSQEILTSELQESTYFSLGTDSSNKGNLKMFPVTVQWFSLKDGLKQGLLDFYQDPAETSEAIKTHLCKVLQENGFSWASVSSLSADNASVNYGIHNSVFQKLKIENPNILKANCKCHILHNCNKYALKALQFDVESLVLKDYSEFSAFAKRTAKLKEFFDFAHLEYKSILRHVPTRWLSLLPALDRLLLNWPILREYFLNEGKDDCAEIIWKAFKLYTKLHLNRDVSSELCDNEVKEGDGLMREIELLNQLVSEMKDKNDILKQSNRLLVEKCEYLNKPNNVIPEQKMSTKNDKSYAATAKKNLNLNLPPHPTNVRSEKSQDPITPNVKHPNLSNGSKQTFNQLQSNNASTSKQISKIPSKKLGTNTNSNSKLQGVAKKAWIYLYRIQRCSTADDVLDHVKSKNEFKDADITVKELPTESTQHK